MPPRQRKPSEMTLQLVSLVLLGVGLVSSNPSATILDDEAQTLSQATQQLHDLFARFFSSSQIPYSHPPLFDILLHFWLRWTGGSFAYLRIPSILLFLAGFFLLAQAARQLTGTKGGAALIWAGALWPFGFHYGRLAVAPLFAFFLVCGLTFAYQKYLEDRSPARWTAMLLFCLALTWTNYFGWAIVGCLAIDLALRLRKAAFGLNLVALAGSVALLGVAFVPFLAVIPHSFRSAVNFHQGAQSTLVTAAYDVYSLFVSESVAPWYWRFTIPAGLAVAVCVVLVVWWTPRPARRLLIYSACLIVAMALSGTLNLYRLLILSPWILLPLGVAIEAEKPQWANLGLAVALMTIGGIGWYGIYSRHYYSAPRFIEPWGEVAGGAAGKIRGGAAVIADHPSFLLYLTYNLHIPDQGGLWRYEGSVTVFVHHPQVYSPSEWLASGQPAGRTIMLIRGPTETGGGAPIDQAQRQLDQSCGSISSRLMVRDQGYEWKQRFLPGMGGAMWRIEVREYDCSSSNSKQIYPIPTP
ncbi:MAG TPA: hypothetical protein VGT24_00155 [Candidatus Acidoferrales bacterium]|nr:hypothetical protein [Candidatus Acidoferrales bacterium]